MAKSTLKLIGVYEAWSRSVRQGRLTRATGVESPVLVRVQEDRDATPELLARLREDARLLARLQHESVLRLEHVSAIGGKVGEVYEGFECASAARILRVLRARNQVLPARAAVEAAAAVGLAFDEALRIVDGDRAVAHPGPGPEEVLVDTAGRVKVAGFRVRRPEDPAAVVARGYAAPEADGSPAAATYMVGALLVELLSGESPPDAAVEPDRHEAAVRRALIRVLARPGDTPGEPVVQAIRQALAHQPAIRGTPGAFGRKLRELAVALQSPGLRAWAPGSIPSIQQFTAPETRRSGSVLPLTTDEAPRSGAMGQTIAPIAVDPTPAPAPSTVRPATSPAPAARPVAPPVPAFPPRLPFSASIPPGAGQTIAPDLDDEAENTQIHRPAPSPAPAPAPTGPALPPAGTGPLGGRGAPNDLTRATAGVSRSQPWASAEPGRVVAGPSAPAPGPALAAGPAPGPALAGPSPGPRPTSSVARPAAPLPPGPALDPISDGDEAEATVVAGRRPSAPAVPIDPLGEPPAVVRAPSPSPAISAPERARSSSVLDEDAEEPRKRTGVFLTVAVVAALGAFLVVAVLAAGWWYHSRVPAEETVPASTAPTEPLPEPAAPAPSAPAPSSPDAAPAVPAPSPSTPAPSPAAPPPAPPVAEAPAPAVPAPAAPAPAAPAPAAPAPAAPSHASTASSSRSSERASRPPTAHATEPEPPEADAPVRIAAHPAEPAPAAPAPAAPAPAAPAPSAPEAAPSEPAAPAYFTVTFTAGDPSVDSIEVKCSAGAGVGSPTVSLEKVPRGNCRVTGRGGDAPLITMVTVVADRSYTCFEGRVSTCK